MAVPKGRTPKQARNAMAGSWFWLALSFAATLYVVFAGPRFDAVIDTLLDGAFVVAVAVALWSTAGRVLGAALRAVAPRPAPIWIFRMNGWTVVTLATGILLALQAGDNPKAFRTSDAVAVNLISMALLGLVWFLVFDLARAALARVAGRATPPILSVGTLAFLAGLGAIAWTVHGYFEGNLTDPPFQAGLVHLGIVLGVGAALTLIIELPRALLARNARLGRSGGDSSLATTRARLAGQLRVRTAEPAAGNVHRVARTEHGRITTPPTVVRRR